VACTGPIGRRVHGVCQGFAIRRIRIILRIVFNAYSTELNKSGPIIRMHNLPIFAETWPF